MRKVLWAAAFFVLFFTPESFAQQTVIETDTPIGVEVPATESSVLSHRVDYELPYPGMLPDNPFYFLKVLRDGMVKVLINDDMTRAKFSLNNAEKRLYAGKMLIEKNKDKLGVETIMKGNNYLDEALVAIKKVRKRVEKNPDTRPFLHQFLTSSRKNLEILQDVTPRVDKQHANILNHQQIRVKNISHEIEYLLSLKD